MDRGIEQSCDLASRQCVPCRGGVPPLAAEQIEPLLAQLSGWSVVAGHHLSKSYSFEDFASALAFVNRVGEVAERNGHHPDVALAWGRVRLDLWTHKIDGLSESDFVLAAKCDQVR
jgi:4a-hydroxytetrahydrobiopterin dehydratase